METLSDVNISAAPNPNLLPCPKVSVIIPVYNAEKYIGEALDSILNQTLQDFEVIVVDDCSKDSSPEVVKSYLEKFGGRLIFSSMKKNSGSAPAPRNKGFRFARGEYIFFMDSDDTFTQTALEEMYTLAKEYEADVVYCEKYYMSTGVGQEFIDNMHLADKMIQSGDFVEEPTLISNDISVRLWDLSRRRFWFTPWQRLVSRKLLVDYGIKFPEIIGCDDVIWCFQVLCCAERFLRVPNMCYVRRMYEESFTASSKKSPNRHIHQWMDRPIRGLKFADDFMNKLDFFKKNPYYRYLVYDLLSTPSFDMIFPVCKGMKPEAIYKIFLKEFANDTGENSVLISYLCTRICEQDKILKGFPKQTNFNSTAATTSQRRINFLKDPSLLENTCAISVVISLYNYEKYIGECLDSLLAQTFQDFEVVVADDCSTDNSVAVVESYLEKFGGRLKITQTEENSGGGGEPRNLGFTLARGEYVFFMDADDALTKTALEELYTLAKEYEADIVYCEKYFMSSGTGQELFDNVHIAENRTQKPPFVDKPTFETEDFVERTKNATKTNIWMTPWLRLVQRKLMIENNIWFDSLIIASNDFTWALKTLFCSKRFLRVPNVCYIRRIHDESVSFRKRTPAEYIHKWLDIAVRALRDFDNFLDSIEFFRRDLKCRHDLINQLLQSGMSNALRECQNLSRSDVYNTFRLVFGQYLGEQDVLVSALFARVFDQGKWWDKRYKKLEDDTKSLIAELKTANQRIVELENANNCIPELENALKEKLLDTPVRPFNYPTISVVIPMYNAEETITETLDSLLIQTFQDFEIIVADDCSTDNSVAIVESYAEKFGGRLQIVQTQKNSGGGGYVPRNLGLDFASGEYVIFLDADDFLLGTALETLYMAAKEYNADVVYSSIYYDLVNPNDVRLHRDGLARKRLKEGIKDKTEFTIDNTSKLFKEFAVLGSGEGNFRAPWSKFVRRDFLLKNEIRFPDIVTGGDCIWCINVYAYAKRFLRLPIPLYFYRRYNSTSLTRTMRTPQEQLAYWVSAFVDYLKALKSLENRTEVLRKNPNWCYEAVKGGHFEWVLNRTDEARKNLSNNKVYEILYRKFKDNENLFGAAIPFFFSAIDFKQRGLNDTKEQLEKADELIKTQEARLAELESQSEKEE